jgi:hypothetical protein
MVMLVQMTVAIQRPAVYSKLKLAMTAMLALSISVIPPLVVFTLQSSAMTTMPALQILVTPPPGANLQTSHVMIATLVPEIPATQLLDAPTN